MLVETTPPIVSSVRSTFPKVPFALTGHPCYHHDDNFIRGTVIQYENKRKRRKSQQAKVTLDQVLSVCSPGRATVVGRMAALVFIRLSDLSGVVRDSNFS